MPTPGQPQLVAVTGAGTAVLRLLCSLPASNTCPSSAPLPRVHSHRPHLRPSLCHSLDGKAPRARRLWSPGFRNGISLVPTVLFSLPLPRFIPVTPVGPALPGHRSTRPYTIFELEQVRQQSRKYGAAGSRAGLRRGAGADAGGRVALWRGSSSWLDSGGQGVISQLAPHFFPIRGGMEAYLVITCL